MWKHLCFKLSFFLVLFLLLGAANPSDDRRETGELKSYQGKELGSVNDFRENSIGGVRKVDLKKYRLRIDGLVKKPLSYSYQELKTFPRQKKLVTTHCVEGWQVTVLWEGIPFSELISRVGVDPKVNTIIFHGVDGYTTSLEFKTVADKNMLLADSANGISLPAKLGFPFILVAEDKWGYKWARWIERVQFSDKANFRGYWEQRGYNQKGDISGPELEDDIRKKK
ncbi:MAG: oxidoreductase molybdopterin binding [Syntrophaceae bacterium]|nr:MAG: oxidoreductase molybdopterin binding [Syntrophaceae bacterium]